MVNTFKIDLIAQKTKTTVIQVSQYTDFNQNPITYGPEIVVDMQTIKQSLDNLFHCKKYQRRYLYDYYVPIDSLIGELYKPNGNYLVLTNIANYVEHNEPRVKCIPKLSQINVNEPHLVMLELVHEIPLLNDGKKYKYTTEITIN